MRTKPSGRSGSANTADLADRLRDRASRRAARSVEDDLGSSDPPARVVTLTVPDAHLEPADTPAPVTAAAASEAGDAPAGSDTAGEGPMSAAAEPTDLPPPAGDEHEDDPPSAVPSARPVAPVGDTQIPGAATGRRPGQAAEPPRPVAGPDGRLELSGERVVKMTLELPTALVDALARWELDETRRTGRRVYRERLIDCALSLLPTDIDALVAQARALPQALRQADAEQVGTRVRESIQARLKDLRPELRVRRVRDVYLRHVYTAAICSYLSTLGVAVETGSPERRSGAGRSDADAGLVY